jgi:hypothetical protein
MKRDWRKEGWNDRTQLEEQHKITVKWGAGRCENILQPAKIKIIN